MHDTVWFEIQGLPAVAVASSEFAQAAEAQRKALGMTSARYVLVPHPIQDATDDEMREKAAQALAQITDALIED
ncbi:Selenoprotein [Sulfitobacter noctilucicola]|uniref:Alkanesulfonate monooxygenase SsuD/methylene tetrahydromethanopterin reductase-like flavin-dependent oxidoreductase (Luciferase family) n=3 Tax=Sulfitobacter noctilucicola TaxID=1342301 RepID=A0A7W6M9I0_9RHOB|nr:Selenoprotein [Sulfitobacter noctilucicola]MBB4174558.1 alkanesulfonate monooxygenase SsuD/methylene tetrahydromethanopterin reductase-like flavin-dependent oxidoreductase (luciferase family) [Sulfitobacter noctilucicola]